MKAKPCQFSLFGITLIIISAIAACQPPSGEDAQQQKHPMKSLKSITSLKADAFDTLINGQKTGLFWIENDSILAAFTNYGARIVGLWIPDKEGIYTDVVVGMGNIHDYIQSSERYYGATIGRVGNRIAKGQFSLEGKDYQIPINNGENSLHGGMKAFQDVVWEVSQPDSATLVFHYLSPDGEEGFPGNLDVTVTYSVNEKRSIFMEYEATTDQPTLVNLTNHAFFNLNGEGSSDILFHKTTFFADQFTPVDKGLIPTGEIKSVKDTPFDFTMEHTIGERIGQKNNQLENGGGYDHNFVLNATPAHGMNYAAHIIGDQSGIVMDVYTEEPAIQFYSGNFMKRNNMFKSGASDAYRTAFALETQHYPDAPNQADFPSIVLHPDEKYHTISEYQFSIERR